MYLHLKTWLRMTWLMLFHKPSFKRISFFLRFALLFQLVLIIVFISRLLDELFFPDYRKVEIKKPVFIIGNPRSGTTFLYNLLALDKKRFAQPLLYQTLLCSIILYKLKAYYLMSWLNKFFARFKKIHEVNFKKSEEDVPFFFLTLLSPAMYLICPFPDKIPYLSLGDSLPHRTKQRLIKHYKRSLQRFMYAFGDGRTYLSKNVFSTGRIIMIRDAFPDARIIYLIRHPYKSIPSLVSLYRSGWKLHSPEIGEKSPATRWIAGLAIKFYKHIHRNKNKFSKKSFLVVKFDDLIKNPKAEVRKVYKKLGMKITPAFEKALNKEIREQKKHKSGHKYSLEQFGLSKKIIYKELKEVINSYF